MAVLRRTWALFGFLFAISARQTRTDPFRTYLVVRISTLVAGSIAGAVVLRILQPVLAPHAEARLYLPALAAVLTLIGLGLVSVRLLVHRWHYVGSLRETVRARVLSAASEAILLRSLPRTYLVVFLLLILGPWTFSAREVAPWFQTATMTDLATVAAGASLLAWWNLGPDCEAAAGTLLWPRSQRPLRYFPRQYNPVGEKGWGITTQLLELPERTSRVLSDPSPGPSPRVTVHRQLVGQMLSELTSRLASVVPPEDLPDLVRTPLPALDGASVLALVRRAAEPGDALTVDELFVRVGGLTRDDLIVERTVSS